jgi:hypothetical protein
MSKRVPYLTTPLPVLPAALQELQPECGTVAGRSISAARLIRKALILELWPEIAGNPLQQQALVYCCNRHRTVRWWLLHQDQVSDLIRVEMTPLSAIRS